MPGYEGREPQAVPERTVDRGVGAPPQPARPRGPGAGSKEPPEAERRTNLVDGADLL